MLPESKFPVTGGIMQTEEIVPRAQSTGLDASSVSDPTGSLFQPQQSQQSSPPIRFSQHIQYPIPSLLNMAVKQEPQEEDAEQGRQPNALSPQTEIEDAQSTPDASCLANHKRPDQASPEFNNQGPQTPQQNGCKKPASRGRRKSRWKLKFHHQALPPEYLDHYEAALAQEAALNSTSAAPVEPRISSPVPSTPMPAFTPTVNPMTDVQSWLQRLAAMQNDIYANPLQAHQLAPTSLCQTTAARRSVITSTQSTQSSHPSHPVFAHHPHHHQPQHQQPLQQTPPSHRNNVQAQPSPRPPMKYSDLPYMGEITLDNSKPRRGRKPKKADICHLIYKNYGTILPGTPGLDDKSKLPITRDKIDVAKDAAQLSTPYQRTDIQNRISSLLEKRLTQERRALEISVDNAREQEEPLNLCIRDLNLLKIRLNEKHSSAYGSCYSKSEGSSDAEDVEYLGVPARTHSVEAGNQTEVNGDLHDTELKSINPNHMHYSNDANEMNGTDLVNNNNNNNHELGVKPNPGLLYWPNAGVFIHPVALQSQFMYYQKLAQEKGLAPPPLPPPPPEQPSKEQRIVPKSIYSMLECPKTPVPLQPVVSPSETPVPLEASSVPQTPSPRPKRNSTSQSGQSSNLQPMKRKRSAIFIPPMPTENNNNPATEVSICKFKFTGGAKPTLQEKKSLSVDSGGNFRYYSGTGDKSMRGYEFFPREALQQPANQAGGSSAGAFLTAAAERAPQTTCPRPCSIQDDNRRKRKTRKSIQREKLEQTFKEKGFLIQTQQLESAEGATYCKFRQLRKFTRYLFRSWKDYLPGNVRELTTDSGEPVASLKDVDQDASEALAPVSPPVPAVPNNVELQQGLMENSPPSLPLN